MSETQPSVPVSSNRDSTPESFVRPGAPPELQSVPQELTWDAVTRWARAELGRRDAEIERLRRDCGEAYQVVGAGMWGTPCDYFQWDVERALDNLLAAAQGKPRPHDDLLPWPKPEWQASGAPAATAHPIDPLDTPLPCDITVGHGTMRKGVKLGTLVLRMKVLYNLAGQAAPRDAISQAALDVLAERHRQISAEGYTPEHDDEHVLGELALAAACYAIADTPAPPPGWPWGAADWKPKDERSGKVRAAALLLADIERLDRVAGATGDG